MDDFCASNPDAIECLPLWKAAGATNSDRIIEGLASVDIRDTEGEIVHPDQLDFSYLTRKGKLNWSHRPDPGDQIGTILGYKLGKVRDIVPKQHHGLVRKCLDNVGVWVRAKLKRGLKKAEDVWTDMTANPNDHGLGFSLQGIGTQRQGSHVVGAIVNNVALTPNPVLAETFAVLAKALGTSYSRSNQTGLQALVPEDLSQRVISTTTNGPAYGHRPDGGWLMTATSKEGYVPTRGATGERITEAIGRSYAMPAGLPLHLPLDTEAAHRALKSFLRHVRALGAERGNVLDGSASYFEVMHGLDHRTARALAQYVREHGDRLFQKCLPSGANQGEHDDAQRD